MYNFVMQMKNDILCVNNFNNRTQIHVIKKNCEMEVKLRKKNIKLNYNSTSVDDRVSGGGKLINFCYF